MEQQDPHKPDSADQHGSAESKTTAPSEDPTPLHVSAATKPGTVNTAASSTRLSEGQGEDEYLSMTKPTAVPETPEEKPVEQAGKGKSTMTATGNQPRPGDEGFNPLRPRGPCGPWPTGTSGPQRSRAVRSENLPVKSQPKAADTTTNSGSATGKQATPADELAKVMNVEDSPVRTCVKAPQEASERIETRTLVHGQSSTADLPQGQNLVTDSPTSTADPTSSRSTTGSIHGESPTGLVHGQSSTIDTLTSTIGPDRGESSTAGHVHVHFHMHRMTTDHAQLHSMPASHHHHGHATGHVPVHSMTTGHAHGRSLTASHFHGHRHTDEHHHGHSSTTGHHVHGMVTGHIHGSIRPLCSHTDTSQQHSPVVQQLTSNTLIQSQEREVSPAASEVPEGQTAWTRDDTFASKGVARHAIGRASGDALASESDKPGLRPSQDQGEEESDDSTHSGHKIKLPDSGRGSLSETGKDRKSPDTESGGSNTPGTASEAAACASMVRTSRCSDASSDSDGSKGHKSPRCVSDKGQGSMQSDAGFSGKDVTSSTDSLQSETAEGDAGKLKMVSEVLNVSKGVAESENIGAGERNKKPPREHVITEAMVNVPHETQSTPGVFNPLFPGGLRGPWPTGASESPRVKPVGPTAPSTHLNEGDPAAKSVSEYASPVCRPHRLSPRRADGHDGSDRPLEQEEEELDATPCLYYPKFRDIYVEEQVTEAVESFAELTRRFRLEFRWEEIAHEETSRTQHHPASPEKPNINAQKASTEPGYTTPPPQATTESTSPAATTDPLTHCPKAEGTPPHEQVGRENSPSGQSAYSPPATDLRSLPGDRVRRIRPPFGKAGVPDIQVHLPNLSNTAHHTFKEAVPPDRTLILCRDCAHAIEVEMMATQPKADTATRRNTSPSLLHTEQRSPKAEKTFAPDSVDISPGSVSARNQPSARSSSYGPSASHNKSPTTVSFDAEEISILCKRDFVLWRTKAWLKREDFNDYHTVHIVGYPQFILHIPRSTKSSSTQTDVVSLQDRSVSPIPSTCLFPPSNDPATPPRLSVAESPPVTPPSPLLTPSSLPRSYPSSPTRSLHSQQYLHELFEFLNYLQQKLHNPPYLGTYDPPSGRTLGDLGLKAMHRLNEETPKERAARWAEIVQGSFIELPCFPKKFVSFYEDHRGETAASAEPKASSPSKLKRAGEKVINLVGKLIKRKSKSLPASPEEATSDRAEEVPLLALTNPAFQLQEAPMSSTPETPPSKSAGASSAHSSHSGSPSKTKRTRSKQKRTSTSPTCSARPSDPFSGTNSPSSEQPKPEFPSCSSSSQSSTHGPGVSARPKSTQSPGKAKSTSHPSSRAGLDLTVAGPAPAVSPLSSGAPCNPRSTETSGSLRVSKSVPEPTSRSQPQSPSKSLYSLRPPGPPVPTVSPVHSKTPNPITSDSNTVSPKRQTLSVMRPGKMPPVFPASPSQAEGHASQQQNPSRQMLSGSRILDASLSEAGSTESLKSTASRCKPERSKSAPWRLHYFDEIALPASERGLQPVFYMRCPVCSTFMVTPPSSYQRRALDQLCRDIVQNTPAQNIGNFIKENRLQGWELNACSRIFEVTPLMLAALFLRPVVVKVLLSWGAHPDVAERHAFWTPLMMVCQHSRHERALMTARGLTSCGANVNARDVHGCTALCFATASGNTEVADYLKKQGAMKPHGVRHDHQPPCHHDECKLPISREEWITFFGGH